MRHSWTFASIGEACLADTPQGEHATGLASEVAVAAARQGQRAMAVSRVGQDAIADRLLRDLNIAGVVTAHVQSDPDLPTPRLMLRPFAGQIRARIDERAAFDNLQWDFDLEDLAQQSDVVVYGLTARRNGQSRSTIDRFLTSCPHAIRVLDLTNRPVEAVDRSILMRAVEFAHGLVIAPASNDLLPPSCRDADALTKANTVARECRARFVAACDSDGTLALVAANTAASTTCPAAIVESSVIRSHAVVSILRGLLAGLDLQACLDATKGIVEFVERHPNEPVPSELLDRTAA